MGNATLSWHQTVTPDGRKNIDISFTCLVAPLQGPRQPDVCAYTTVTVSLFVFFPLALEAVRFGGLVSLVSNLNPN